MKKLLVSTLAAFVLLATGTAFAQPATHDVTITIPDVAFLRFTADTLLTDTTAVTPDAVVFLPTIGDVQGTASIAPDNALTANWGDLKVFVNYASNWTVTATAVDDGNGFIWSKVGVGTWNVDGGQAGSGNTTGWTSLGFGAADFLLTLDGTEIADTYGATITYTLSAP